MHGEIIAVYNDSGTKLIEYNYYARGVFSASYKNGGAIRRAVIKTYFSREARFEDLYVVYLGNCPDEIFSMIKEYASNYDDVTQWYYD